MIEFQMMLNESKAKKKGSSDNRFLLPDLTTFITPISVSGEFSVTFIGWVMEIRKLSNNLIET